MAKNMEKELKHGKMEIDMKVLGKMIKCKWININL
jgi:hypothetical protein